MLFQWFVFIVIYVVIFILALMLLLLVVYMYFFDDLCHVECLLNSCHIFRCLF